MRPFSRARSAGFTLTELMLAVAVLGILVAVGMPSFSKMIRNQEVRSAAESVSNGIGRARAEAVSHNARVQFTLGASASTDTSWYVDYVSTPNAAARLDSRASTESVNAKINSVLPVGATTVTFNQLGQMVANADASPTLTQVNFSAPGGNQILQVRIGIGGNARVCDPDPMLPATNFRSCSY